MRALAIVSMAGGVSGAALLAPARGAALTVTKIADTSTAIPGGSGNFTSFDPRPAAFGLYPATFVASGEGGQLGMYAWNGGTSLLKVADTSSAIPSGSG